MSPLQIGVDHVALDRAGPNDRDLDDEIVESLGFQTRQHVHLRPALDLEDTQRIPFLQHRVNCRILLLDIGERQSAFAMRLDECEAFADTGEHSQRQNVDLQDTQSLDVVLVPFYEAALGHRAIPYRHGFRKRTLRQDETADMLREMARQADQLVRDGYDAAQMGVSEV